jgi:glutamate formiminotransferase
MYRAHLLMVAMCAQLVEIVTQLATMAVRAVNLRDHVATHPRLGVVDHISCHPLDPSFELKAAGQVAHSIGISLSAVLPTMPVLMYGAACPEGRRLQDVRRACGVCASLPCDVSCSAAVWSNAVHVVDASAL